MSHADHSPPAAADTLAGLVAARTETSPLNCYQCGRCAAGCFQNIPGEMDVSPTRLMRLVQLESAFSHEPETARAYADRALGAETPWLCAGCLACTTRCPQNVDIAGTMDVLRQEALRRGAASKSRRVRDIQALHAALLAGAMARGRVHELSLVLGYKLRTGHLFQDAMLGPAMFLKGKLHLLPGEAPGAARVRSAAEDLKKQEGTNGP